jgi:nickel-dependent lactate racemase
MDIKLPYDQEELELNLDSFDSLEVTGDIYPDCLDDISSAIDSVLQNPEGSDSLRDILPLGGKVSVLISDLTRGGGVGKVLSQLLSILSGWGVKRKEVEIFLATGMHRRHSERELRAHIGEDIIKKYSLIQHDPTDNSQLCEVGKNYEGSPYLFNRRVVESDLIIVLGTVSFHYFAGYGGARKLILPGVAGEKTILSNHRLSLKDDPALGLADGCESGNLDQNPVHLDMLEGTRNIPVPIFVINSISDNEGRIVFINAGELEKSHLTACRYLRDKFRILLKKKYKALLISAGGYPGDVNLLQSHKAIRNASRALDEGGIMLVAAACREGIGSNSYYQAFGEGRERVAERARDDYTLNSQTAVSTVGLTSRFSIYIATELDEDELSRFGFLPWEPERTEKLLEGISADNILVVSNASKFLPVTE